MGQAMGSLWLSQNICFWPTNLNSFGLGGLRAAPVVADGSEAGHRFHLLCQGHEIIMCGVWIFDLLHDKIVSRFDHLNIWSNLPTLRLVGFIRKIGVWTFKTIPKFWKMWFKIKRNIYSHGLTKCIAFGFVLWTQISKTEGNDHLHIWSDWMPSIQYGSWTHIST